MSLQESQFDTAKPDSAIVPRLRAFARSSVSDWDAVLAVVRSRAVELHPLVMYRLLALAIALVIITSSLHGESTLRSDWRFILIAAAHVVLTGLVTPWIGQRSRSANLAAVAIDGAICILLLAATYGWRGPFWLYAISAVFWPAHRFSWRGVLVAVTVFDALVLLTNVTSIRDTVSDGFGGDLLARMLTVYVVAGAISLTNDALTQMRRLTAESERNRIARDLHDGIGKTMGGISMEARSVEHWIERDPREAQRRAHIVARISERAANEVRDVIRGLRRSEATEPLMPSVRALVDGWIAENEARVHLQLNGPDLPVPILLHSELIRMLTELLSNVARHSRAREVWVRVTLSSAGATLAVRDDGVGFVFDSLDPWADEGHFGLLGTRERVSMLGGRFRLVTAPGSGTEVTIDLPLIPREERAVTALR